MSCVDTETSFLTIHPVFGQKTKESRNLVLKKNNVGHANLETPTLFISKTQADYFIAKTFRLSPPFLKLECLREVVVNYTRKELTQLEHLGGKTGAILYY